MIEIHRDEQNNWHWTLRAPGPKGRILAVNESGYAKRSSILKDLDKVKALMPNAGVIEKVNL